LLVWVISKTLRFAASGREKDNGDPGAAVQARHAAACLVMSPFPCNRIEGPDENQNRNDKETPMIDQQVEIPTKDGHTTTFISHPERGGPFPVILFYMDAPAIREELRDMARRLATSGYYVMLPNLYYRSGVMELGPIPPDPDAPERKRMFGYMNSIDIPKVMEDTRALLTYADGQAAANTKIVGTVGYCMSGRYAVSAATHFPDRVKAAASVYGTHLATDQPDSPHLAVSKTKAELYFACAETDIYAPQEIIDKVKQGMKGSNNEVEIYPGTHHGFAFPKRPVYHRDAAERHWERLLALYRRNLAP
jgi:carboxymethylenebutenolidase